jgi:transketolase
MPSRNVINSKSARQIIIEQANRAHVGHIGSALSVVDILVALHGQILRRDTADENERDRFILSNGHTALALYAVLHAMGILSAEQINQFCSDQSYLGVHPEFAVPGIDFASGSLGQGLSIGAGCALAARLQKSGRRVFVLLSDAECNEGSVWEAVMFAAHRRLSNLVAIIDLNGQQAMGYTQDVLSLSPMHDKWSAFGWDVHEADGNSVKELTQVLGGLNTASGQPHVLIAHTVFGKGVSFMEHQIKWHYMPLSSQEYQQALHEIRGAH